MTEIGTSQEFYDEKVSTYAEFANLDLLRIVQVHLPPGGSVLDVGCGSGGLLDHLTTAGRRIGIEVSPTAAAAAAEVCDSVIVGDLLGSASELADRSFDVVVCGDVIEHIGDTSEALRRLVGWLKPGGTIVVSVPNIANWQARLRLLRGMWRYEDCGIWDAGHVRFFTAASLQSLLRQSGVEVLSVTGTQALTHQLPRVVRAPLSVRTRAEHWSWVLAQKRPELFGFQLIAAGRRPTEA